MLKVALNFIKKSTQLRTLILSKTNTEAGPGRQFLADLLNCGIDTLENLDLNCPEHAKMNCKWFNEQEESVSTLMQIVANQPRLETLNLIGCPMTQEQKIMVRVSLPANCKVWFTMAEKESHDYDS